MNDLWDWAAGAYAIYSLCFAPALLAALWWLDDRSRKDVAVIVSTLPFWIAVVIGIWNLPK